MRRNFLVGLWLLLAGLFVPAIAQNVVGSGVYGDVKVSGGGGGCADATTFLARGSFNAGHTTAYTNFICGLNTDGIGIFTNAWDVLVILGTQNSTVAALNLPSTSFSPTPVGSPAFAADAGYTGVDGSATVYIDTNYNVITNGINYTQDCAHVMVWPNTNVTSGVSGGVAMSAQSGTSGTKIVPKYNDGNAYADIDSSTGNSMFVAQSSTIGQFFANRDGLNTSQLYYNGSSIATGTSTSTTPANDNVTVLASNNLGTISFGSALQAAAYSTGRCFNSTEVGNFYSRMRTLGTALGWN